MNEQATPCPVCGEPLSFKPAQGRKSAKPFIQILCPQNARHFRAFICHQPYVEEVFNLLENHQEQIQGDDR